MMIQVAVFCNFKEMQLRVVFFLKARLFLQYERLKKAASCFLK